MSAAAAPVTEGTARRHPPLPGRRWRGAATAVICGSGAVTVLVGGASTVGVTPFTAVPVAMVTVWALRRPAGWGAVALLVVQALAALVPSGVPTTVVDWALAAAAGCAVVCTHLCLSLLAAVPVRADLPRATAGRWIGHAALLSLATVLAALLGLLASRTPTTWGPYVATAALLALAALAWAVRAATRRGR